MRDVSSAYWARMQEDGLQMVDLIELRTRSRSFYFTTAPDPIVSSLQTYQPFIGGTPTGTEEGSDLSTNVIDFVIANTGSILSDLVSGGDFQSASISVARVFADTPDLGRMVVYNGVIGDYSYDRLNIRGQARGGLGNTSQQWPYYTYQDTCVWRFGGPGCGFDTSSITIEVNSASIIVGSTTSLVVRFVNGLLTTSFSNGWFDFGRLTVTGGVNSGEVRTVRIHSGDTFALSHPLSINSHTNLSVSIYPGCRRRKVDDCSSKYNNLDAFLGWPTIPIQEQAF